MGRRININDVINKKPDYIFPNKVTRIEDDGTTKEFYVFEDNHGYVYKKEVVIDMLEKAIAFYNLPDSEEWIVKENKKQRLNNSYPPFPQDEDGNFLIPEAEYKKKPFKTFTKWTTKCSWCNKKLTVEDEYYYLLNTSKYKIFEHACSDACTELLWKEAVKNWIHENDYKEFFKL